MRHNRYFRSKFRRMATPRLLLTISAGWLLFSACNSPATQSHGPIKLGDPATIITETDPARLQDVVAELKPATTAPVQPVAQQQPADTAKHTQPATVTTPVPPPQAANGINIAFKEVTIVIPGITAKQFGKTDLTNATGAVYSLLAGQLQGSTLRIGGAAINKVSQRYQVVVVLKGRNGYLPLESLGATTSWAPIQGANGIYPVKGLTEQELIYPKANESAIRNAVQRAARSRRLSRAKTQEWLDVLGRNIKATNQRPLAITLRSVMWKIDGKDASNKPFSKQIRIDIPL